MRNSELQFRGMRPIKFVSIIWLFFTVFGAHLAFAGGAIPIVCKDLPLGAIVGLEDISWIDVAPQLWIGPYGVVEGSSSTTVNVPEGEYFIHLYYISEQSVSEVENNTIWIGSCFTISSISSRGKVKLAWLAVVGFRGQVCF